MCGIFGFVSARGTGGSGHELLRRGLDAIRHRGPDGEGVWLSDSRNVGLAHARLSIIDLDTGAQPMSLPSGNVITYNGEIYNYIELREELGIENFTTRSDTEVILRAYERWGAACVEKLRGMFAFAIWDAKRGEMFVARDRFGIKPFYYVTVGDAFYFSSEVKGLLSFMPERRIDAGALNEYFSMQFCLGDKTLLNGVRQLSPAHCGFVAPGKAPELHRYWEVFYKLDWDHTEKYFVEELQRLLDDSVNVHMRADVEVGAYISGGVDSSLIAAMAREGRPDSRFQGFTGKFSLSEAFDESRYARAVARDHNMILHEIDITEDDFVDNIENVIYHLDQPVAGPGSFPQYMVSKLASQHLKVVLGGQGGDEIFGGYARYLIAYFEQCIKAALDGTIHNGNYVVTYESIIPNLQSLRGYKPLIQEFWSSELWEDRDRRYFRLINRANTFSDILDRSSFDPMAAFEEFKEIYWGDNVGKESYFDSMTHFDFKTLLPALLQVEDRMSMAHGLESRVPFLDHRLIEFAATIPANVKFANGELKRLLRVAFSERLPKEIRERKDKMGFPVPLQHWLKGKGRAWEYICDVLTSEKARHRSYLSRPIDVDSIVGNQGVYSRNLWALLSLELWQRRFVD
ncbi:asparagine synthase (glutamine-hydrolyzing) [Paraburkholderia sp. GAS334]|uniref:asparagine synthase (glutamine-hydrolyzing) n=1 Tax=Paraburkholderia sp. GAS334 TaxID=3035131 RepID=UPI003D1D3949